MDNNLYCLYNVLSGRYGDVVAYPTDGFALARLAESLPQVYKLSNPFDEFQLCRIATFDVVTGLVKPEPAPVRIPWNLPSRIESEAKEEK